MPRIEKGTIVEVEIEDYAFEGEGVARFAASEDSDKKFVLFVRGAYPGDKVKAKMARSKKSFGHANIDEVLVASPDRVDPRCPYFGTCGGCKQQDLNYAKQVEYKSKQVKDIFERIGGLEDYETEDIIPAEEIFNYRNKMEFSFANKRWLTKDEITVDGVVKDQNFAVGLHIPRIYDKVLDIKECHIQIETNNGILNFTRDFFKEKQSTIYQTKTHEGYLRHLVIKNSFTTNDLMVNLVTSSDDPELMQEYSEKLLAEVPAITTIVNNINQKKGQTAYGDFEKIYHGDGFIYDSIGDYKFRISANSFFQTNTPQAEKLYKVTLEYAEFKGDEIVYDLYSGAGTITSYISKYVKEAIGLESAPTAIEDAGVNKDLNGITNTRFFAANLDKSCMPIIEENNLPKPDVIIADPPRGGMNRRTVNDIQKLSPEKVVYISCNPSTQARDIKMLTFMGYKLVKIRAVDMFPHTYHIENVALLVKDENAEVFDLF